MQKDTTSMNDGTDSDDGSLDECIAGFYINDSPEDISSTPDFADILITKSCFDNLSYSLNWSGYIPTTSRKYLIKIFSAIAINEINKRSLLEIFGKKVSEMRYIRVPYRRKALYYLEVWKDKLMEASYSQRNAFVYMNGQVKKSAKDQIRSLLYVYKVRDFVNIAGEIEVYGTADLESFTEDLRRSDQLLLEITKYTKSSVSDDSQTRFGDIVPEPEVDVPQLPMLLHSLQGTFGRGSIGAIVEFSSGPDTVIEVLLTNAHVVFGGLYNCLNDSTSSSFRETTAKVQKFNENFKYGSYRRDDVCLDYAFVATKCIQVSASASFLTLPNGERINISFEDVDAYWRMTDLIGRKVYKCGMASGVTTGTIISQDSEFEIEGIDGNRFAIPGDSGSLVFCEGEDETPPLLYPLALHYRTNADRISFAIPLAAIFEDLRVKQGLQEMQIRFTSPKLSKCTISASASKPSDTEYPASALNTEVTSNSASHTRPEADY